MIAVSQYKVAQLTPDERPALEHRRQPRREIGAELGEIEAIQRDLHVEAGGREANRWKAMAPSEKTSDASVTLRGSEIASGGM